jgi:hypothetical protein
MFLTTSLTGISIVLSISQLLPAVPLSAGRFHAREAPYPLTITTQLPAETTLKKSNSFVGIMVDKSKAWWCGPFPKKLGRVEVNNCCHAVLW